MSAFLSNKLASLKINNVAETDPNAPEISGDFPAENVQGTDTSDNECVICQEPLVPAYAVRLSLCNHIYDLTCFTAWVGQCDPTVTCPLCRRSVAYIEPADDKAVEVVKLMSLVRSSLRKPEVSLTTEEAPEEAAEEAAEEATEEHLGTEEESPRM